jgi:hypothetical protein
MWTLPNVAGHWEITGRFRPCYSAQTTCPYSSTKYIKLAIPMIVDAIFNKSNEMWEIPRNLFLIPQQKTTWMIYRQRELSKQRWYLRCRKFDSVPALHNY